MAILFILLGFLIGIVVLLFLIKRWFVSTYRRLAHLQKMGTRVMATVTDIETNTRYTYPKAIYKLVAQWQQPQTGKIFTYKRIIKNPDKFPIGSAVPVMIDPNHPTWHIMEIVEDKEDTLK